MILRKKKFFIVLFALFFMCDSYAQKIGVVLSGGGAKGLYHIGILKALEDNDIPIDYISGTSMGAIVGGLYASGYTPWEIEQIVLSPEIIAWVSGKMDLKYSYFYNHLPERPTMVNYSIDINYFTSILELKEESEEKDVVPIYYDKNREGAMPSSLVSSTQLDIGLMRYFSGASAVAEHDFDSLYIPFRCISVDAVTKTQRFWKDGNLSLAIRASMAIPIVFSPVIIDSTVMFDGSVLNNFPWKESYDLWKPDFIIGGRCVAGDILDVSTPMGQGMALMFSPTDYAMPDSLGVMIARAVDVSPLDFTNAKPIIDSGYNDAMKAMSVIIDRSPRFISKEQRNAKRLKFKKRIPEIIFYEQQVENELSFDMLLTDTTDILEAKRIRRDSLRFEAIVKKQKIDNDSSEATEVIGMDDFLYKYYNVISEGSAFASFPYANYNDSTGVFDFDIELNRKPVLGVDAGINVSTTSINQAYLGISYRRSKRISSFYNLDGYVGAFYNSGQLSTRFNFYRGDKNIYLYNTFTYNNLQYDNTHERQFAYLADANINNSTLNEFYVSSLMGMPIGVNTKVELRLVAGVDNFGYEHSEFSTPNLIIDYKSTVAYLSLNSRISSYSLNDTFYPTKGMSQQFSASVMYGNEDRKMRDPILLSESFERIYGVNNLWASVRYTRTQFFELSKRFSLGYHAEGVLSLVPDFSEQVFQYMAPRFAPTQILSTMFIPEFQNYNYVAGGVIPSFKIANNLELRMESYFHFDSENRFNSATSFLAIYKLPFASISLSYSRLGIESVGKDYFIFNFGVMMFNPRGIIY